MTEQPQTTPILTVTWDTVIGARPVGEREHDTGYQDYEEISLGDAVVNALAAQLGARVDKDADEIRREARRRMADEVSRIRVEVIREEITAAVRRQLAKPIQKTNTWGEPQGETTTLNDLILAEVNAFLSEKPARPGYSDRERPGGLVVLLREEVGKALAAELKAEIEKARAAVRAEVAKKAGELFGDVVKQATR